MELKKSTTLKQLHDTYQDIFIICNLAEVLVTSANKGPLHTHSLTHSLFAENNERTDKSTEILKM